MYSGKTDRLLDAVETFGRGNVAFIKPHLDTRHAPRLLVSHGGRFAAARPVMGLDRLLDVAGRSPVIAIDELQFFDEAVVTQLQALRAHGRRIVAAGLDLDFMRRPFGVVPRVAEIADSHTRLRAVCDRCGRPADFTQRLAGGRPASPGDSVVKIGGSTVYKARCGDCYEHVGAAVLV